MYFNRSFTIPVCVAQLALIFFFVDVPVRAAPMQCSEAPRTSWSDIEKRAWTEGICIGNEVDLSKESAEQARISNEFIRDLLLVEPWRSNVPIQGIQFRGAIFDKLNLQNLHIRGSFQLLKSVVEGTTNLYYARADRLVDFSETSFKGLLNLTGFSVDSSLVMKGADASNVWLMNARISQNLYLDQVYSKEIVGRQARIGGDLILIDALVERLLFTEAKIDGTVKFDHSPNPKTPNQRSEFGEINFQQSQIGGNFLILATDTGDAVNLTGASIKRDFIVAGSTLGGIYGGNMSVSGDLIIRPGNPTPTVWRDGSKLDLRSAEATKIGLDRASLPAAVDFNGLTYKDFRTLGVDPSNGEIKLDVPNAKALLQWITKSTPPAPLPYIRAAQFLKDAGYENEAQKMSIAGREISRAATSGFEWIWESIKYHVIGYGYDLTGVWIAVGVLLLAGWHFVRRSAIAREHGFGLAYSFDLLLPIVRLRDKHYSVDLEPYPRAYFYFHRLMGYVLASFLIAGLSGLTKVS